MYLTRIQLDLTKTKTMQALAAPKLFHGAIECAEPEGERGNSGDWIPSMEISIF